MSGPDSGNVVARGMKILTPAPTMMAGERHP